MQLTAVPQITAVKLETQVVIQLKCRPGVLRALQGFDCILVKLNCLSWLELLRKWESQARELVFDHLRLQFKPHPKLRESETDSKQSFFDISVIETDELYIFTVDA